MPTRTVLTAVVAGLACAQALAAPPAPAAKSPVAATRPAAVPAGPWSKVPALPTACFESQDHWLEQVDAAVEAVQQDLERQKGVNGAIGKKFQDAMSNDPFAVSQAMTQAMMSDPQNAQKIMQRLTQQGEQAQTEIPEMAEKESQLEAESKAVLKQYYAALEKAYGPGDARWTALKKKGGYEPDAIGPGESGVADWIWAEWDLVIRDWKNGYAANCAQWWAATGPIHAYMKRYKDFLVNERIPSQKTLIEQPVLEQYELMHVPTTGWRTTTDYEAAEDYMRRARDMFGERKASPECEINCR